MLLMYFFLVEVYSTLGILLNGYASKGEFSLSFGPKWKLSFKVN